MKRFRMSLIAIVLLSVVMLTASTHNCPGWLVVANGSSPSDQTVAGTIASKNFVAEIIYVQRDRLPDKSRAYVTNQADNRPYTIIVVGGRNAVSGRVVRNIQARVDGVEEVNRVAGEDRYHTAALSNFFRPPSCD